MSRSPAGSRHHRGEMSPCHAAVVSSFRAVRCTSAPRCELGHAEERWHRLERCPGRAAIVDRPESYRRSSVHASLGLADGPLVTPHELFVEFAHDPDTCRTWLSHRVTDEEIRDIRSRERPLGSARFQQMVAEPAATRRRLCARASEGSTEGRFQTVLCSGRILAEPADGAVAQRVDLQQRRHDALAVPRHRPARCRHALQVHLRRHVRRVAATKRGRSTLHQDGACGPRLSCRAASCPRIACPGEPVSARDDHSAPPSGTSLTFFSAQSSLAA